MLSVRNLFGKSVYWRERVGPGGGRLKRGTHCSVDGTLCTRPVGGKLLTLCIINERSKNPYCHAGVDFQVVI